MAFRRLLEAECGQSNPIEQLSSHVRYDQAQEETIAHPFISGRTQDNFIPPQSFRMEDLIQEMRGIESDMDSISPTLSRTTNHLSGATWMNESSPQMTQGTYYHDTEEPLFNELDAYQQYNFRSNCESPRRYLRLHSPQQLQLYSEQFMTEEEFTELQNEIKQSQKSFWEHIDNGTQETESESLQETEIKKVMDSSKDLTSTSKPLICWDGLCLEDDTPKTDCSLDDPHLFDRFECAYFDKYYDIIFNRTPSLKISVPNRLMDLKPFQYIKNNHMLEDSTALEKGEIAYNNGNYEKAVLCFEAAVQQNSNNIENLLKLCKALLKNNEFLEGLCIASQILKLEPNNLWAHWYIAKIYAKCKCRYQECQYTFNWLRFNKAYADIVPPNFKMEDKTTTELDDETLKEVTKMFIKAAQRTCYDPDVEVQWHLGNLCYLSGEYEKSSDCLNVVSNLFPAESLQSKKAKYKLGFNLFYSNQPLEALRVWFELAEIETEIFEIYHRIGFIYMYLKNYREAAYYLTESLKEMYPNTNNVKYRENFSRLSLCIELLQNANFQNNRKEDIDVSFPEFMKSICEPHLEFIKSICEPHLPQDFQN